MDINIMNTSFDIAAVLDGFSSFIWNERYNEPGNFEIVVPANSKAFSSLVLDNYLQINESEKIMIIEKMEPLTDAEAGQTAIFSGRSLESILDRRIVWTQTTISGNLQNAIKRLLNENIINPSISARKISNFIFQTSSDTAVTSITIDETQFTGDNLLTVIETLCQNNKLGFKITLNSSKQFVFSLYAGKNRTTSQNTLPQVVFSLDNDNLFSSKRTIDKTNLKNVTLIGGEGEGLDRKTATYGTVSGFNRREYFTDARDISSNEGREDEIPAAEYTNLLIERGKSKLAEQIIKKEVEAEVDTSEKSLFKYQEDYFIGDLVENVDEYGQAFTSRITEMTTHITGSEYSSYPIFEQEDLL